MFRIYWKSELNTGVREIDEQHQHLVHLLNAVLAENSGKADPAVLKKVLLELIDYTKYHFDTEEKHMESHHYNDLEEHKLLHKSLVETIVDLLTRMKKGKALESEDLLNILRNWLVNHIINEDMKYSRYLRSAKKIIH